MKRVFPILLALVIILGLAACKEKEPVLQEPVPDSAEDQTPPSDIPEPPPPETNEVVQQPVNQDDYLKDTISELTEYIQNHTTAHYLGRLQMDNGTERHVFLFRLGQEAADFDTYAELTNKLSIISEEPTLVAVDRSTPAPSPVQSFPTNYGIVYIYDFGETMDIGKYVFQQKLSTDNSAVDWMLEPYSISIGSMVDITSMPKLRNDSLDIYRVSTNLWALPDTMEFSFVNRELNELDENVKTRMNYSSEITFLVWGNDTVPMTAELLNESIAAYPHYEIKSPAIFQSPVMPYNYTISCFYDEGVVTDEMDANPDYLSARESIESQFVLVWGDARVPFSTAPASGVIDINAYLPPAE